MNTIKGEELIKNIREKNVEKFGVLVQDDLGWMYEEELKGKRIIDEAELKESFDLICDDCPYISTCDENCKAYDKLEEILRE